MLIYAINVYNLHVRTASFPDPEKLLKSRQWLDMRLMNVNTKIPEMKHNPYTKYLNNIQVSLVQFTDLKNDQELKFTFQNIPLVNNL